MHIIEDLDNLLKFLYTRNQKFVSLFFILLHLFLIIKRLLKTIKAAMLKHSSFFKLNFYRLCGKCVILGTPYIYVTYKQHSVYVHWRSAEVVLQADIYRGEQIVPDLPMLFS